MITLIKLFSYHT